MEDIAVETKYEANTHYDPNFAQTNKQTLLISTPKHLLEELK